jgi:hypothetical protein
MGFARKPERRPKVVLHSSRAGAGLFARTVLVGLLAIAGAAWALARHCSYTPPPLRVPLTPPREAPTYDADGGELPVPDWAAPESDAR